MIDSTSFGSIKIQGKVYYSDVLVFWDKSIRKIKLQHRHVFSLDELRSCKKGFEVLIIGTGQQGLVEVSEEVKRELENSKIELIQQITPKAIGTFNQLLKQGKKVVGYFHVTC